MSTSNALILGEKKKKDYKVVLPFWRVNSEKNVVFALVKKSREHFLELAVRLSASGVGRRCPFSEMSSPSLCKCGEIQGKLQFACFQQRLF